LGVSQQGTGQTGQLQGTYQTTGSKQNISYQSSTSSFQSSANNSSIYQSGYQSGAYQPGNYQTYTPNTSQFQAPNYQPSQTGAYQPSTYQPYTGSSSIYKPGSQPKPEDKK